MTPNSLFSPANLLKRISAYIGGFPRAVWMLVAATLIESTGRFMVVPYLSLYMRDAGVSLGTLGLVLGAAPVANVLFGAWGGHLSDKWGRKPVQILGVGMSGLAMFGFAFAGADPIVLAVLNFFNGMTRTFYRPATNAAIADFCPANRRSEAYAINRIFLNAAFGLGPILGVAIFTVAPRAGFMVGGSLNLVVGLFLALAVPESAPSRVAARAATRPSSTGQAAAAGAIQTVSAPAWRRIAGDAGFWVWISGMTLVWGAYDLIQSFLPLHLRAGGVALWTYGSILAINAFVCVVVQLPLSRKLRTGPIGPSAGLSKLLFIVGFLGFAFTRSPLALMAFMFVLSLGEVWGSATQNRYLPEHAPPELLGRYMGLSMVSELGRAVVAPAAGFLMQAAGGQAVFVMAAALAGAGGLLLFKAGHAQDMRASS